jgi:hypothetical protein
MSLCTCRNQAAFASENAFSMAADQPMVVLPFTPRPHPTESLSEGSSCSPRQKTAVKIHHAKKSLQLFDRCGTMK